MPAPPLPGFGSPSADREGDILRTPRLGALPEPVVPLEVEEPDGRPGPGGSAQQGGGCRGWGWGLFPPLAPGSHWSPGTRQAATGGELATKAYSSGFKKVLKPIQLSFVRCSSGIFPLQRLLEIWGDKGLICEDLIMARRPQCKQLESVCSTPSSQC